MSDRPFNRVLRRSALAVALGFCFTSPVSAQSNAAGTIFGSANPGEVVVVESLDTGVVRELQIDANGRYRATALPVGRYKVSLKRDGQVVATEEDVSVLLGTGSEVSFANGGLQTLDSVQVRASRVPVIDVSATDTRAVFTAEQLAKIPVQRNINDVALLTPGVVAADSRYPGAASFGGSSASENAIYINGYAVTNPLTNLGSTTLPFDGIGQYQAIIGGYGAEFGRATGGVVNILTKRGTNDWVAGGQLTYAPASLRSEQKDIRFPTVGTANDGTDYQRLSEREVDELTYGVYVGGPIIRDRLFFYASGEMIDKDIETVGLYNAAPATRYQEISQEIPRWLAKVDWNITDNHLLEFTAIGDKTKDTRDYFSYSYADGSKGDVKNGGYYYEDGGELYIGKYTGYLTQNLTLTALYGQQDQVHVATPFGYDPSRVAVTDNRPGDPVTGLQPYLSLARPDANDETEGGRIDLEWQVGDHTLRVGYDRQDSTSTAGTATSGPGYRWIYEHTDTPNEQIPASGGAAGPGGNGDYVYRYIFANGGTFKVEQEAQYIEDRWQVSDNVLLSLGLRNEQFANYNADGVVYVKQRNQIAPRLGASWDVNGDSTLKAFANAGRYHLALPNNVALRGAAGSLYTTEYFAFTGIDPVTGEPLGLRPLGNGPYSANNEYGQAPDPDSVAAKGLKSHYQDEVAIGFEKQLTEHLTFGARGVYRELQSAIDDMCDPRPAEAWALRNGYDAATAEAIGSSLGGCRLFNPGEANTFMLDDGTGNLVEVALTADDLGFPKLKRSYFGIDLFLERPFDGKWYGKIDYTFSKNYGNMEGQLNSDLGQQDVSQTVSFDHPELMVGSNGYLPNDRRHFLKAFGYYQLNEDLRFSATLVAASGRPKNCLGYYTEGSDYFYDNIEYGNYYFSCDGERSPRGSDGRLPGLTRLDLGVAYAPGFLDHRLQFSVDVFNVFDKQSTQNIWERYEQGGVGTISPQAGRTISYTDPRSVRFMVRYDFK